MAHRTTQNTYNTRTQRTFRKIYYFPDFSFHAPRKSWGEHRVAGLPVRLSVRPSVRPYVSPYVPNSCQALNRVISSQIFTLFHRNNHHIETTCRVQNLDCYLLGQGHSMTLQQNRVRPITLLFKVRF